jgi:acyl-CoA synthetase (AMP-forming)/AMP-acid ligase II
VEDGLGQLGSWLARERITIYHSVPSLFRGWMTALSGGEDFSAMRAVEFGGETLTSSDIALFRKAFPPTCVLASSLSSNETGPIRRFLVDHAIAIASGVVPVGYPVEDKHVVLLDDDGHEVGANQVGEIVVRSRFLSPGYWRRPDLTARVFATDAASGERIYRTGDLGSFLPDGCLVHRGRKDSRAKIRGIRVETEEVQAMLQTHPSIREAVVAIGDDGSGGHRLIAHVTTKPSEAVIDAAILRGFVAAKLPDFMVPAAFVFHEALPRLASGKVDRRALVEFEQRPIARGARARRARGGLGQHVGRPVWRARCQPTRQLLRDGRRLPQGGHAGRTNREGISKAPIRC